MNPNILRSPHIIIIISKRKRAPPPSSLKVCVKLSVCVIILDKTVKVFSQTQELIIIEQVGLQGLLQYRV